MSASSAIQVQTSPQPIASCSGVTFFLFAPTNCQISSHCRRRTRKLRTLRFRDLVYERIAPGLLTELEKKCPQNEKGQRSNKLHQWLTEDIANPMLAQDLHSLVMFQRLALSNGHGWNRFVKMVDRVLPGRGDTLTLPFPEPEIESS